LYDGGWPAAASNEVRHIECVGEELLSHPETLIVTASWLASRARLAAAALSS
jgi:hypothetical protein